jgi:hypothetical protein
MAETQNAPQTVTIDGEQFLLDSMDDNFKEALMQIAEIDREIEKANQEVQLKMRNLNYAKQYLVDYVASNKDKFTKVVPPANNEGDDLPPAA